MTVSDDNVRTRKPPKSPLLHIFGNLIRIGLPVIILGCGAAGYYFYSGEPEEAKRPPARKQQIRTRVADLQIQDYSISVTT